MSRPEPQHVERTTPRWMGVLAVLGALAVVPGGAFLAAANVGTGGKVAIGVAVAWWALASSLIGRFVLSRRQALKRPVRGALVVASLASIAFLVIGTRDKEVDETLATGVPLAEAQGPAPATNDLAGEDGRPPKERGRTAPRAGSANRRSARAGGREESSGRTRREPPAGDPDARADLPARRVTREASPGPAGSAAPDRSPPPTRRPAPAQNVQLLTGSFGGASGHSGRGKAAVVKLARGGRVLTFSEFNVDRGAGSVRVYLVAGNPRNDRAVSDFKDIGALKGNVGDQQYSVPEGVDLKRYSTVVIWCVPFSTRIAQARLG